MATAEMKKGPVILIIQARMGSTRLPGKSLMPLAGKPLVFRLLERAKRSQAVDRIVLAIPSGAADEPLAVLAAESEVDCFRGSESDLLDRYYQAARAASANIVLRLPADNPVVESGEIDRLVAFHRAGAYAFSTNLSPALGSNYPDGIGVEAIDFWALERAWAVAADSRRREHVHLNFFDYTTGVPADEASYPVGAPACPTAYARPDLVLDVNTAEDYRYLAALYEQLYPLNPQFGIHEIIHWHDTIWKPRRLIS